MQHQINTDRFARSTKGFIFSNLTRPDKVVDLNRDQGVVRPRQMAPASAVLPAGLRVVTQECDIRDYLLEEGDILYFLCQAFIFRRYYKGLSIVKI